MEVPEGRSGRHGRRGPPCPSGRSTGGNGPPDRPLRTPHDGHLPPWVRHPRGATAQCKDGTFSYSAHFSGTCSHHRGVRYWFK
ncbi:DUF3761 domain-containing protein [Streptomyces sp. RPT161]|uniref:DUF3761 domain-containing protein n=1 Tax=Streptomyces sp. RPT161 TaxID=3015993 RepID=UPI0022B89786|nr:DUF3761 domain-containing protein [Streptomyces sp. RPT161]